MDSGRLEREYLAWTQLLNLRLVQYYLGILHEIKYVFYLLNIVDSKKFDCTLSELFRYIDKIDEATRKVIEKANIKNDSYQHLFQSNRQYFCKEYAYHIVENTKILCISLDNFYEYVNEMMFRKYRDRYTQKKTVYVNKVQSMITRIRNFSVTIQTSYNQDCQET